MEKRDIDENALIVASVLDPSLNIVPFNSAIVTPIRRTTVSPRMDYQINASNTMSARYTYTTQTHADQGVGQFALASRGYSTDNTEQTVQMTETAVLNARTINETRFQYIRERNNQQGVSTTPDHKCERRIRYRRSSLQPELHGPGLVRVAELYVDVAGTHQVKFGARLRGILDATQSTSNFNGTFTFAGGRFPVLTADGQIQLDASGQSRYLPISHPSKSIVRRSYCCSRGSPAVQIRALGYGPNQFTLNGGMPLAGVNQFDIGLFVQDDWRVQAELTVSGGLRYEGQTNIQDLGIFRRALESRGHPAAQNSLASQDRYSRRIRHLL